MPSITMAISKLRVLAGAAIIVAGCAGHDENEGTATTSAALDPLPVTPSNPLDVYVAVESCVGSGCSIGYLVREVNRGEGAFLVSRLDVSRLSSDAVNQATGGGDELLFRGQLGKPEGPLGLRTFAALEAWRGLPGVSPFLTDRYFAVQTSGQGSVARALNDWTVRPVDTVTIPGAPRLVDTQWLTSRVLEHGALVAGRLDGATLEATQVFLALPGSAGVCTLDRVVPVASTERQSCGDETATYERDENLCLVSTGCAVPGLCPMYRPACGDGYVLASWPMQPAGCPGFACDPAFLSL